MKGTVDDYEPANELGHIEPDDGRGVVSFKKSEIVGRKTMPRKQRVEFELEHGPKGPEAVQVARVDE